MFSVCLGFFLERERVAILSFFRKGLKEVEVYKFVSVEKRKSECKRFCVALIQVSKL